MSDVDLQRAKVCFGGMVPWHIAIQDAQEELSFPDHPLGNLCCIDLMIFRSLSCCRINNPVARLRRLPLHELQRRVSAKYDRIGLLGYAAALGVTSVLRWGCAQDFIELSEQVLFLNKSL